MDNPKLINPGQNDGSQPPAPAADPAPSSAPPQTYPVTIDGKVQQLTLDELTKHAQKGIAADARFQEAARIREEAARDQKLAQSIRQLRKGFDEDTFREVATGVGMTAEEIEATIAELTGQSKTPAAANPQGVGNPSPPRKVKFSELDKELQDWMVEEEKQRQERDLRKAIESDQVLGYHTGKRPDSMKSLLDLGKKVLRRRVAETGGQVASKARLIEEVVGEIRSTLTEFGTILGSTPTTGLGPATSNDGSDIYPTKLPDRVSVVSPEYEENLSTRLSYLVRKLQSEGR